MYANNYYVWFCKYIFMYVYVDAYPSMYSHEMKYTCVVRI